MTSLEHMREKHPAPIVGRRVPMPVETLTAPYYAKTDLVASVHRQSRRGEVRPLNPHPIWSAERQVWEQRVVRVKPRPPAWRKPLLIGLAIATALGSLAGLGYWLMMTLATLPLGLFLGAALIVMCVIMRAGKTTNVYVSQNVTVNR